MKQIQLSSFNRTIQLFMMSKQLNTFSYFDLRVLYAYFIEEYSISFLFLAVLSYHFWFSLQIYFIEIYIQVFPPLYFRQNHIGFIVFQVNQSQNYSVMFSVAFWVRYGIFKIPQQYMSRNILSS